MSSLSPALLPFAHFEGRIVPFEDAKVSVATHALQYGTGVFGGVRGYQGTAARGTGAQATGGAALHIFRLREHLERFSRSAGFLRIRLPYTVDELCDIVVVLTQRNAPEGDVYFRPYAYKAGLGLTPTLSGVEDGFALYMLPMGAYYNKDGLDVAVSSWTRLPDTSLPARGKIAGAYVNSALARDEANVNGFDEAILLNARGKVSEGSASNLMMVRGGVLITPPVTADILEGITRRALMTLARDAGIEVVERDIDRSELYVADELFFCGTGVQLSPILSVDRRPVGSGEVGPLTRTLRETFFAVVRGERPQYAAWLTSVPGGVRAG